MEAKNNKIGKKGEKGVFFSNFAKKASDSVGSPIAFLLAIIIVVAWLISGPFFKFSETWQLIINTGTTVIVFLIVFLIQHTQNRDIKILDLKLDELIKTKKNAKNTLIDLNKLSDDDLKLLEEQYRKLVDKE